MAEAEGKWWRFGGTGGSFTPLGRALFKKNLAIVQALIGHPGTKASQFKELHYFLKNGDTEKTLDLLKYFSDEELSTDKIGDMWAVHTIHDTAFSDDHYLEFTKKLILEYVARGWDPDSMSTSLRIVNSDDEDDDKEESLMIRQTLLHLACFYDNSHEMIVFLVEELGVDIERKMEMEEFMEMTPLMLLLIKEGWESARYLIEKGVNLNARAKVENLKLEDQKCRWLMNRNLTTGNLERISSVNAVELLVSTGDENALPLLDYVLGRPEVVWHGGNEFHQALDGRNPVYTTKVLKRCAKLISKDDLNWVRICTGNEEEPKKVPCLVWMFHGRLESEHVGAMADLLKLMAQLGYDLNSVGDPFPSLYRVRAPLIFYILKTDLKHETSDLLLRTLLKFDHLQHTEQWQNAVWYLLYKWDRSCFIYNSMSMCWKSRNLQHPPILATVKLLLAHGFDVSGLAIGPNFYYHRESNLVLKMLYRAGAKISEEFFTSLCVCQWGSSKDDGLAKEIEELKEWKDDFDRGTRFTLKHVSALRVRKTLKCVGDLKMLDGLPKGLKEAVLGTSCVPPVVVKRVK